VPSQSIFDAVDVRKRGRLDLPQATPLLFFQN